MPEAVDSKSVGEASDASWEARIGAASALGDGRVLLALLREAMGVMQMKQTDPRMPGALKALELMASEPRNLLLIHAIAKPEAFDWSARWLLPLSVRLGAEGTLAEFLSPVWLARLGSQVIPLDELLCLAVASGQMGSAKALIQAGCGFSEHDSSKCTPLTRAAYEGDIEMIQLLLSHDRARSRDGRGRGALMSAAEGGKVDAVRLLLNHCDPLDVDHAGRSALHLAAASGNAEALLALLPVSDPGLRDASGLTPLMLAAESGRLGCAKALLPVSDPALCCLQGRNALMRAIASGSPPCMELLLSDPRSPSACPDGSDLVAWARWLDGDGAIARELGAILARREREALQGGMPQGAPKPAPRAL